MSDPMISVRGVSKRYRLGSVGMTSLRDELQTAFRGQRRGDVRDFWALRDVCFDLPAGTATGIIGRNGAGKSTLLKLLSRITEPTTGEILLRGRVGSLLEIGTGFHPELSGRDNIFLNGSILGMRRAEIRSKFDEIVEFSEISQFLDTPVKRYSSGMYVKLAFSIAAHLEPEILIIDEVLAVGDAAFQRKCLDKMQVLSASDGRTILFVSHSMPTIRRLCRQCVLLENGKTGGVISTESAIEQYSTIHIPSGLDLDVSRQRRDWGSDGALCRILRIMIPSGNNLKFRDSMEIEVTLLAEKPLQGVAIGFGFNTIEGQRIMTLDSDGRGRTIDLNTGETLVRIRLDSLPLNPGRYYVGAAVFDERHFFDILDSFALWEVETSMRDYESNRGFGGCRITPEMEIVSIAKL